MTPFWFAKLPKNEPPIMHPNKINAFRIHYVNQGIYWISSPDGPVSIDDICQREIDRYNDSIKANILE
jgi:hypothetical protein